MTRIFILIPSHLHLLLLLLLLLFIPFITADDVTTTSSEPFLPCTSFTSLSTALTPIAADDPTACSRLQHTLKSVRAVCEYDRPEPVYMVLTGPGDRNKRRVTQILTQHYESSSILQLDGIHYQQQYVGVQEQEKKQEEVKDADKKKGKEKLSLNTDALLSSINEFKDRAVDLMTDALAHAAQDTAFSRAHRQKQKQSDANAADAATQRELRTVIDEHLTKHTTPNINTSPIPIIIMHNMQYLHPTSLTFLEKHTRPLLFVGIMTDTSTSISTSIKTSTLTQLLATFQPKFRQKWIVIPFDVPDVTVNVTALISEFHTRRAPSTSITSSSSSSSPPPPTTLDSSFIGQRQLLTQVKSFLDDELHGWNLQDGPTVFVFVGPPGVGKTYLASLIAHMLSRPLLTLDMGLYKDKNDVDSLVGPRVGIVGNGFLYEHMKENPDSVVLMDEIEKAHSSLINEFLLPVFGSGYLQDKKSGIRLAIPRSIWILTSNCFEDTVASRWSSLLHQSPSELHSSMVQLQSEINTDWIQDDSYICPGTKRVNPFASKAFVDRIRGRVMVFTPYHLDEAQRIAELELEKLHVKMSTEREGSTRSSRHHFNLLWTSDIPLFFARRHVYTSTSIKHGGKSIRDLQRDIMEYVNRVIRQDVRPHLDANEPLSDVILTLNEDKTDIHAILHHDETTTSTSTTTPQSKSTPTSTVPNTTTSTSTKSDKAATSSTPSTEKDKSSSEGGSTPVQDEGIEVEIEASPTIAKMSSLDSSQTYHDIQSKHQSEIRSHVEQYNSLLQEHEQVQAELRSVQLKMEEMSAQHTHMMTMLSMLAAISLASLFFFSFSSIFFFASSIKVIATLATAAITVVALACWYFPIVAQLVWYLLTFLYQHWRYVIPFVGITMALGPRFIFPLLASLLRRKRKEQSTQTDASTETTTQSRPPLPPQHKQKQPQSPAQSQQQQQQHHQQQSQPLQQQQPQSRRSRRQQERQAQVPAEQEAETVEQLQPQAQASAATILPPPVPIGRVTRSGRSPSPATRVPTKASQSRSPSPSLSVTPSPSSSTKLQSPQITPISVTTSPAPSMSSDSSASPAPPNVWMSPSSAQVEISPQTELAVSMAHLAIAPTNTSTSTSAPMDFAAMSPPSFILERATSEQMRSVAQDDDDDDDLDMFLPTLLDKMNG